MPRVTDGWGELPEILLQVGRQVMLDHDHLLQRPVYLGLQRLFLCRLLRPLRLLIRGGHGRVARRRIPVRAPRAVLDHSAGSGDKGDGLDAVPRRLVLAREAWACGHVLDVDGLIAPEGLGHHVVASSIQHHVAARVSIGIAQSHRHKVGLALGRHVATYHCHVAGAHAAASAPLPEHGVARPARLAPHFEQGRDGRTCDAVSCHVLFGTLGTECDIGWLVGAVGESAVR